MHGVKFNKLKTNLHEYFLLLPERSIGELHLGVLNLNHTSFAYFYICDVTSGNKHPVSAAMIGIKAISR